MKANELMIGDWADFASELGDQPIAKIITVNDLYMIDNGRMVVRPIPLTPEILEKNRFKKDFELKGCYWRPDCRKYCIVKEIETWYFAFRHMGGGHICISECNYVHELQHALRLCKVDKEIVL